MNNDIVGIDLGTTNSLIGVMEAGFPILLADANGARLTPSVVHFPETGEPLVGAAASRMRAREPRATIYSVKRLIGLRGEDLPPEQTPADYEVVRQTGQALRVQVRDRKYAPEEISALVLKKLKADAEAALERSVARAVITVPAYFNDAQRNATESGRRSGRFHGRADRQRTDRRRARLRARQARGEIEDRGLRSWRRHVRHLDPRVGRRRFPGARDERQHAPRRGRRGRGAGGGLRIAARRLAESGNWRSKRNIASRRRNRCGSMCRSWRGKTFPMS